ncbi:pirin [Biomphalaria pfeifferi]|uniref:Pirin n=1 Tax=Biomphalaria pfeifferi TaxID=112525 RepID=A0AAD8AZQ5_BIOPF|nr:pirin [Biomphalaria pfeifferi]
MFASRLFKACNLLQKSRKHNFNLLPALINSECESIQFNRISIGNTKVFFTVLATLFSTCQDNTEDRYLVKGPAMSRTVNLAFESVEQSEGAGARVRRSIGRSELRNFDPFLMLDEFSVKAPAGFPDHPHRGFETVTYMLEGETNHEDFLGHKGTIKAGDLQWMTAGRGIVHCEMPGKDLAKGLQLWINLRKTDKMIAPAYQELLDKDIPKVEKNGVQVKVIAGEAFGIKSPVYTRTPAYYLDFKMSPGSQLNQPVPKDWNTFVYILSGEAWFGPEEKSQLCKAHHTVTFNTDGDSVHVHNKSGQPCHFVVISGQPIREPVVQHGPFVMTTQEEIRQAFNDYRSSKNGFENAATWNSEYTR